MSSVNPSEDRDAWRASLSLAFLDKDGRTVLARQRHKGPLVVQKPLYPEGPEVCHVVLLHPPGGIAGGDDLGIAVGVGSDAKVVLTTPAATKWYRSDGRDAWQLIQLAVGERAAIEYLPQETIVYNSALPWIDTSVTLGETAIFAGWEITCLGRRASGEAFGDGHLRQHFAVRRHQRLIWHERLSFTAGDPVMRSPVGLGGCHVFGTMVVAAGAVPPDLLEQCRVLHPQAGEGAVTALPEIVAARYRGASAEQARDYFEELRAVLRPWYAGRPAMRPRLWAT
jgi:urease accessory protein